MNKIFDESPYRRADYERLTDASRTQYPLKFCAHLFGLRLLKL